MLNDNKKGWPVSAGLMQASSGHRQGLPEDPGLTVQAPLTMPPAPATDAEAQRDRVPDTSRGQVVAGPGEDEAWHCLQGA